jgi:hypothetical protein
MGLDSGKTESHKLGVLFPLKTVYKEEETCEMWMSAIQVE